MNIVCNSCQTKYVVADEKLDKPIVQLKCRKCGHMIRTSRIEEQAVAGASELRARLGLSEREKSAPNKSKHPAASAEPVDWYYSCDGHSFGPFTRAVLLSKFADGELGSECYVWHRELGEWKAAHSTSPFATAIAGRQPVRASVQLAQVVNRQSGVQASAAKPVSSPRLQSLRERLDERQEENEDQAATLVDDPEAADADDGGIDLDVDGASRVVSYAALVQSHRAKNRVVESAPSEHELARDALFAAIEQTRHSLPESAPVERSMIIHIDHLRRQNRRMKLYAFGALGIVGVVIAVIVLVSLYAEPEPRSEDGLLSRSVQLAQSGRSLDGDELERLAPEDDFSIAEAAVPDEALVAEVAPVKKANSKKPLVDAKAIGRDLVGDSSMTGLDSGTTRASTNQLGSATDPSIKSGTVPLASAGSYTGVSSSRRGLAIELGGNPALVDAPSAPSAASRKVLGDQRNQFIGGLKQVSKSVQECHKRQMKDGTSISAKVYISLTVEPSGHVSHVGIDKLVQGTPFEKCLLSKVDRWTFEAFEGKTVELRQGFVLE